MSVIYKGSFANLTTRIYCTNTSLRSMPSTTLFWRQMHGYFGHDSQLSSCMNERVWTEYNNRHQYYTPYYQLLLIV